MTPDAGNAVFELSGALLNLLSVRALLRDRKLRGFSPAPLVFFMCWGAWNLWFYNAVAQPLSALAAGILFAVNVWQLVLIWNYRSN